MHATQKDPVRRREQVGRAMLLLALALALSAALRNFTGPWECGMRGQFGARYTQGAVANTLEHGLGVTLGMPAIVMTGDGETDTIVNWHHPPLYWLWVTGFAAVLGLEPWVMRLAHLVLFLPGFLALFALVRRRVDPVAAGSVALLFATAPLVAYWGPMVLQDGAVLSIGLTAAWSFDRHVAVPSRGSWWRTAGLYFLVTSLDIQGHFWGPALFVLALVSHARRRALLTVFSLFPVSLAAFAVTACHYGLVLGGPLGWVDGMLDLAGVEVLQESGERLRHQVWFAIHEVVVGHWCGPILVLAALGSALSSWLRRTPAGQLAGLGFALIVPGVLNCTAFFPHALIHPLWSVHGFAGVATLAGIVPVAATRWWQGGGSRRALAAAFGLATVATVAIGVYGSHELNTRNGPDYTETSVTLRRVEHLFGGCAFGLTSTPVEEQQVFGATTFYGSIEQPEQLDAVLALGYETGVRGRIVFVLHPRHANGRLRERLDRLAEATVVDGVRVYRFVP